MRDPAASGDSDSCCNAVLEVINCADDIYRSISSHHGAQERGLTGIVSTIRITSYTLRLQSPSTKLVVTKMMSDSAKREYVNDQRRNLTHQFVPKLAAIGFPKLQKTLLFTSHARALAVASVATSRQMTFNAISSCDTLHHRTDWPSE